MSGRAFLSRGLAAVVIASAIAAGIHSALPTLSFLWNARHGSRAERRAILLGPLDAAAARLRAELPPDASVALVMTSSADRDAAVFLNAALYPRRSRIFDSVAAYRANVDSVLYHDARAVNAAVRLPRPEHVVLVDSADPAVARVTAP